MRCNYYIYFMDEKMDTQRGNLTYVRSQSVMVKKTKYFGRVNIFLTPLQLLCTCFGKHL